MPRYDFGKFPKVKHQEQWAIALAHVSQKNWQIWEVNFFNNIHRLLSHQIKLSEEQVWRLEQLYAKYT